MVSKRHRASRTTNLDECNGPFDGMFRSVEPTTSKAAGIRVRKDKSLERHCRATTMLTLGDEDDLLKDIQEGIQIAMHRQGVDAAAIDRIKFNKLAYFAIQEYDIPVTFGWYKYGPAPVNAANHSSTVRPVRRDEIVAADTPRLQNGRFRSPEEYSYFFTDDFAEFDTLVETPTKEYLVEFYFQHAPKSYRDAYIASAELQQTIDAIGTDASWGDREAMLGTLERRYRRLVRETRSIPTLDEAVPALVAYGDLLLDVVESAVELGDLSASQRRFLDRVTDSFYGGAWNYAALLISRDTVDLSPGSNQSKLRTSIEDDVRDLRTGYDVEIERLRERASEYDLAPERSDTRFDEESIPGQSDAEPFDDTDTASLEELQDLL